MTNKKFSDLTAATTSSGTDIFCLVQGGVSKKITFANLLTALGIPALPVTVPNGGTGNTTLTTAYGVLCAGTTATGAVQNAGAGTAGQILTSNGASALPSFQAAPSSVPQNTPVIFTAQTVLTLTVDFTTNTDYELIILSTSGTAGSADITVSQDAISYVGYSTASIRGTNNSTSGTVDTSVDQQPAPASFGGGGQIGAWYNQLSQPITSKGMINHFALESDASNQRFHSGVQKFQNTAAVTRVKITFGSAQTGAYILRPKNKR